jgi:membrane fusion protein (multidrug efflux system)
MRLRIGKQVMLLGTVLLMTGSSLEAAETFQCLVEPSLRVELASGVPGILDEVLVGRGDFVKKGQVVARLRSGVERAAHDLALARAEFAARRVERSEELYQKQMISIHEKDEMETESRLLKLAIKEVEERLKLRTLSSPIDGVVVKRHLTAGEYVQEEPILALAQLHPLQVEVIVPVRLYGKIRAGTSARIEWEGGLSSPRQATVTVVDPVVDAASGTIGVRLEIPNPDYKLPAGTQCSVTFPVASAAGD